MNTLLCVADHCLRSTGYINVIVSDKQKHLQYMTMDEAIGPLHQGPQHLGQGEQRPGHRAGRRDGLRRRHPDQGGAGRRRRCCGSTSRELKIRFINVVDLYKLMPDSEHPARALRPRLRQPVHDRQAHHLQLPRLPVADPPPDLPADEPPEPPRARLQGEGQHQHAARSGHPEPDRPLQPGHRRDRSGAVAAADRAAHAKEQLRNMQIECQKYAYEHGIDKPEVDQWTWPY